jgi:hypothetical protein
LDFLYSCLQKSERLQIASSHPLQTEREREREIDKRKRKERIEKCRSSIRGPCSSSASGIATGLSWSALPLPEPSSPSSLSASPVKSHFSPFQIPCYIYIYTVPFTTKFDRQINLPAEEDAKNSAFVQRHKRYATLQSPNPRFHINP